VLIEADTDSIEEGDELKIDLPRGVIANSTKNTAITFTPLNNFQLNLVKEGGIINYLRKYKDLRL
jgi:3-isopropylmalate/(R)-2-methylmalate dehydratase small subunit